MPVRELSLDQARRAALAAQGFDKPRPGVAPNGGHIRRIIRKLGLLQLDFVNVLIPAHYFVLYSRLGPYDCKSLDSTVYQGRDFIEHWAHEASIVPVEYWPLLRYRRQEFRPWPNSAIMQLKGRKKYLEAVLETVRSQGPVTSNDLPAVAGPRRKAGEWQRSVPRWALEYHFGFGGVSVAGRLPNFQRVYDIPERIVDEPHYSHRPTREDAQRQLLEIAARASGVATVKDLADYFRMPAREAAPRLEELVESGSLRRVRVEGWNEAGFLHRSARVPGNITAASLLSPFDPVVWFRPRAERLFDFHYRIEIYVPASKRKWGYYVLPFLLNDKIAARVDLKADRKSCRLLVLAAHAEENVDRSEVAHALAAELRVLAGWLGLEKIKVSRKGGLARELGSCCRA